MAPCAVGKSLDTMAPTASRPTPGQENIVSVTTAPPSRNAACRPISVTTGISALRSAWWTITTVSRRPLARAVRTKSAPSTSSTAVRVSRAIGPISTRPRVAAGRIRLGRPPSHIGPVRPVKGSSAPS